MAGVGTRTAIVALSLALSIGANLFNAALFGRAVLDVKTPLFAAALYTCTEVVLALALLAALCGPAQAAQTVANLYTRSTLRHWTRRLLPCALATALTIALSNASLRHISLGVYIIIKSSSPLFLLFFAVVLGVEALSVRTAAIGGVLIAGLVLSTRGASAGEDGRPTETFGVVLVVLAAVASGLRWTLVQMIIDHERTAASKPHESLSSAGSGTKVAGPDGDALDTRPIKATGTLDDQLTERHQIQATATLGQAPGVERNAVEPLLHAIPSVASFLSAESYATLGGDAHSASVFWECDDDRSEHSGKSLEEVNNTETRQPPPTPKKEPSSLMQTPLYTIVLLAPLVSVLQLGIALAFELRTLVFDTPFFFASGPAEALRAYALCSTGGALAFLLALLDYQVVHETSALFFSMLGIVKEAIVIGVSVLILGDALSWPQLLGALVSMTGIGFYAMSRRQAAKLNPHAGTEGDTQDVQLSLAPGAAADDAAAAPWMVLPLGGADASDADDWVSLRAYGAAASGLGSRRPSTEPLLPVVNVPLRAND